MTATMSETQVTAPMAGLVVAVLVKVGERVEAGDVVCITETMKCESSLIAGGPGWVSAVVTAGDTIDAEQCLRIGLANRVVADADIDAQVAQLARRLADGPAYAQAMTKKMVQREMDMDFASAIEAEAQSQALLLMGKDHAEFHAAWKAKRPPKWSGR